MKKFLPKTLGFTLIELLVVVSVIAILSVIGLAVFNGQQAGSRDARRKADIGAISAAMEANYDEAAGAYKLLAKTYFASDKVPLDPLDGTSNCDGNYCGYCSSPADSTGKCASGDAKVADSVAPEAGKTYKVCANLEKKDAGSFCLKNQR